MIDIADFTLKTGDLGPPLVFTLETQNPVSETWVPIDLTNTTAIVVQLRDQLTPTNKIYLTGTKDADQTANPGKVSASWVSPVSGTTNVPGVYDAEVKTTWANGEIRTFPNGQDPNAAFFTVEIEAGIPDS